MTDSIAATEGMPEGEPRWLEYIDVDALQPHPDNPKDHDDDVLDASLERFGYTEPVMVDERTGLLAAGHGRRELVLRARARGEAPPEGVVVRDGQWLVPVVRGWSSADDVEAKAWLVASNQTPAAGGWVDDRLAAILAEAQETSAGLDGLGWSADELDTLMAELGVGELPDQGTEAAFADLTERGAPAPPRTVQGLHEVGLMLTDEGHREYLVLVAQLRERWGLDATPSIVLRALREAAVE